MSNDISKKMMLNITKTALGILFPLVTYPYAARVLGAVSLGKVSYSSTVISYFALISSLGISQYAIREGGVYRSDNHQLQRFAGEIFSFNIVTTVIAYLALFVSLCTVDHFKNYTGLILIHGMSIAFATLSVDWLVIIFEDYAFITKRSFIVQLLSAISLFCFVHAPQDYYLYAMINTLSAGLIALANFIHVRRKCVFSIRKPNIVLHLKPVLVLFANNLAVSIYTSVDIAMTGFLFGDYYVGIYYVSSLIYTVIKRVVAAAYSVTVTSLTERYSRGEIEEFKNLLNMAVNNIILLSIPATMGGILISEYIITVFAGEGYAEAIEPLRILLSALPIAVMGGAIAYCLNMPMKRETTNLFCTGVSAIENILLNAVLMPQMGISGAAIATLLSEATVVSILLIKSSAFYYMFDTGKILSNSIKTFLSSFPFVIIYYLIRRTAVDVAFKLSLTILVSAIVFVLMNCALKNEAFMRFMDSMIKWRTSEE